MVRKTKNHTPEKCDYDVALVDWEYAGWYPIYWDYSLSFALIQWEDDWPVYFERFLKPWVAEEALMRMIYQHIHF